MKTDRTIVWGLAADQTGIVKHTRTHSEEVPGTPVDRRRGFRVWQTVELNHEPASAYALTHEAPMAMRWGHKEEIGRIVALRRANGRLLAVGETEELEPSDLAGLTEKFGELRWSTSTNNRRDEKLRIDEISLTTSPATIGLPAVKWYKLGATKGNMPQWVQEELKRAEKTEFRFQHRGELKVHDLDYQRNPNRFHRDVDQHPIGGELEGRHMTINGERVPIEYRPAGRILSVGGRPVRSGARSAR